MKKRSQDRNLDLTDDNFKPLSFLFAAKEKIISDEKKSFFLKVLIGAKTKRSKFC